MTFVSTGVMVGKSASTSATLKVLFSSATNIVRDCVEYSRAAGSSLWRSTRPQHVYPPKVSFSLWSTLTTGGSTFRLFSVVSQSCKKVLRLFVV
jgi:hypothetical protein